MMYVSVTLYQLLAIAGMMICASLQVQELRFLQINCISLRQVRNCVLQR